MATKKKKKRKFKNGISNTFAVLISIMAVCFFTMVIVVGFIGINAIAAINGDAAISLSSIKSSLNQTTFLYATDSDGETVELARLHGTENRVWVNLEDIPEDVQHAFVALEDKTFYKHNGVNWKRTVGVALKNNSQGGSTITQQLIKNITGNNETTYVRKYHEILTALNIEKAYAKEGYEPKDEILEAYLNTIYLGHGCYGVQTAAESYYGKNLEDLNLAEIAALASTTKNPYALDPMYHREDNKVRRDYCLKCMLDQGYISEDEYKEALNTELVLVTDDNYQGSQVKKEEEKKEEETKVQGYYVDFVINQVISDLMETQNCSRIEASNIIYGGGLQIYTAVDLEVQEILEDVYVNRIGFIDKKKAQSSMTIMDYQGRVVGIIGGAGVKEGARSLNRATDSPRPPGSSIKPLSAYAPAMHEGKIYWSSMIADKTCTTVNGKPWPKNYNGDYGSGANISVQVALARSLNTIPASIIYNPTNYDMALGQQNSYKYLTDKLHISTLNEENGDNGVQRLAIGAFSYGVTSLELTAAYCTLGNGGKYYKPYSYYKVLDSSGEVVLDNTHNQGEQVFSAGTADVMREMMKTVITSSIGTGYGYGVDRFETFAKTGTTDDYKDKWFAGGTSQYFASVWYGYDQPERIYCASTVNPAGEIFKVVMNRVHKNLSPKEMEKHSDIIQKYYCPYCGKLTNYSSGSAYLGWFDPDNLPSYCVGSHYSSYSGGGTTSGYTGGGTTGGAGTGTTTGGTTTGGGTSTGGGTGAGTTTGGGTPTGGGDAGGGAEAAE
ncbi:MAG: transglycosylase domain-containing protein [Clostridia bacterium]|nr:transglycosylase domain-containing protein [Clostridia bacterium]